MPHWRAAAKSPVLALAALAGFAPAVASAAPVCVVVEGPTEVVADIRQSLGDRGLGPPSEDCSAARLSVTHDINQEMLWSLVMPDGTESSRQLDTIPVGSSWVDSMLRSGRLSDLLSAPIAPPITDPTATVATPPTTDAVRLYASFEAWKSGVASDVVQVPLLSKKVSPRQVGPDGLEPMWALNRGRRDARQQGAVFAFEHAGEVYVHDDSPRAFRNRPYGRLDVHGDRGLYQFELCYWVSTDAAKGAGYVQCDVQMRILDLDSGAVTVLNRAGMKQLLADHPELLAEYRRERPKTARVVRRYALAVLEGPFLE